MKLPILTTLLFLSTPSLADSWTSQDKKLHFSLSFVMSSVGTGILGQMPFESPATAAFHGCMAIGLAKEILDSQTKGKGSWKDIGADLAGCALGSYTGNKFFISPNRDGMVAGKIWRY